MSKELMLVPTAEEMTIYTVMAKKANDSKFFDKLGGEPGILSIMLMARELGIMPMQAIMGGMSVIMGKVELSPRLMNSMIRKAGHRLSIVESTDTVCEILGVRHDTGDEYKCRYTIEDAKKAGLIKSGGGWDKYASDMLFARCLSRLARRLFTDVISSAYAEGEIDRESKPYHSQPTHVPSATTEAVAPTSALVEAEVSQPSYSGEYISTEEATFLDGMIPDEDEKYRVYMLKFCTDKDRIDPPLTDFSRLPKGRFEAVKATLTKRSLQRTNPS